MSQVTFKLKEAEVVLLGTSNRQNGAAGTPAQDRIEARILAMLQRHLMDERKLYPKLAEEITKERATHGMIVAINKYNREADKIHNPSIKEKPIFYAIRIGTSCSVQEAKGLVILASNEERARIMYRAISEKLDEFGCTLMGNGSHALQETPASGLFGQKVPGMEIIVANLSNPEELKLVSGTAYCEGLAFGIASGLYRIILGD